VSRATASAAPALRTEVIDDLSALDAVIPDWDALAVARGLPLSAPGWLLAWWRSLAPVEAALRVVVVRDAGGSLVGLAPYYVVREGGLAHYRPLGSEDMGVRNVPLAADGMDLPVARAVAAALARARPAPSVVHLSQVDAGSPWPLLLSRAWPGVFPPRRERGRDAPAPTLRLRAGSYEEWLASKSSNFRQRLRRDIRKLEEQGSRTWMARTPEELEEALSVFHRLHAARWGDESPLASEAGHRMMLVAGQALLPAERFRVWTMAVGDTPITVQIFVAAGGEVTYWNGGWDADWSSYSPAMIGIAAGVEDAFARGERRVDFGEGEHHYKTRLADGDEPITWVRIIPRDVRYPRTLALTAPARAKRLAKAVLARLPAPVRSRVDRIARRGAPAEGSDP
jgi:CelD/BcsL family acetyltransferase involved in cellulose biosynthesis